MNAALTWDGNAHNVSLSKLEFRFMDWVITLPDRIRHVLLVVPGTYLLQRLTSLNGDMLAKLTSVSQYVQLQATPQEAQEALPMFRKRQAQLDRVVQQWSLLMDKDTPVVVSDYVSSLVLVQQSLRAVVLDLEAVSLLGKGPMALYGIAPELKERAMDLSYQRADAEGYFDRDEVHDILGTPKLHTA